MRSEYIPAYIPDPDKLAALAPPEGPIPASLGAATAYDYQRLQYDTVKYDLVAPTLEDYPDPREASPVSYPKDLHDSTVANIAAGYVTSEDMDRRPDQVREIDAYYQQYFTDEFYARHHVPEGTPLSSILRQARVRGVDGSFSMPKSDYIDLLTDLAAMHGKMAAEFEQRLPAYASEHVRRLHDSGLSGLVPIFEDRMQRTHIELDDGFTTLLYGGLGFHAVTWYGARSMRIAPVAGERRVLGHEFNHMAEGNGLRETFQDAPHIEEALREALAEHLEQYLLQGGDIQAIDPTLPDRQDEQSVYDTYRRVFDLLCNGGSSSIPVHDFIDVNVAENKGPNVYLRTAIAKSFPDDPDIINKLDTLIKDMQAGTNEVNPEGEARLLQYIDEVRKHYALKPSRLARVYGLLLRKSPPGPRP